MWAVAFLWAALAVSAPGPSAEASVQVSCELSATSLRATDTLALRLTARWDGGEGLYRFATPHPVLNPHLQLAGQSTHGGAQLADGAFTSEKVWLFNFVCVTPGSTEVVPPVVVYTNTETEVIDSVSGSPMLLTIGPAPAPPFDFGRLWPYLLGLFLAGALAYLGLRLFQRHRLAQRSKKLHKTPEQQAAELLDDLRALKREDRCEQFYADLEKIALGLWEARIGRRLIGKTPSEVAGILQEQGVDEETRNSVRDVLTDCHTVRFSGGRVSLQSMDISFGIVSSWVKPASGT
jgi:hypothetical protein